MLGLAQQVKTSLVRPALVIGGAIIGCAFVDHTYLAWPILAGVVILGFIAVISYARCRYFPPDVEPLPMLQQRVQSAESAKYVQDLFSPYTQCAAAAAEELGRIGDASVVPSLINVLDRSAWRDETGWERVCEAIVMALASIGDGRALPALNRISGARGPRFRSVVDSATASITNMQKQDYAPMVRRVLPDSLQEKNAGVPAHPQGPIPRAALVPLGDEDAFRDSATL